MVPVKYIAHLLLTLLIICNMQLAVAKEPTDTSALILAIHPYLRAEELQKRFSPLADYLARKIGHPVTVRVGTDYNEHIEYIGLNKVDIAFLGPASYVRMVNKYGRKPILARLEINGRPVFDGKIVTRKESKLKTLADLKGKRVAFGDSRSTMSYLVPRYMLSQAGIELNEIAKYEFLGSHANVALAVLAGDFDAGAVKTETFNKYEDHGLRVLAKSPLLSEHLFVTRKTMPADKVLLIKKAMHALKNDPKGVEIMQSIKKGMTALVPARDSDYQQLRKILKATSGRNQ